MKLTSLLGHLQADEFLSEYWQKRPLLIRQAFTDFNSPVTPEELAGLACEAEVESRLILERDGEHPWDLRTGPFTEADFGRLPATHWTLLIQDIEKHLPELTQIIDAFHFIPDWRLDDLMVSYAPEHGSVGPHLDAYDVFLLQAQGKRHWKINTQVDSSVEMLGGTELKIIQNFEPDQEWILEPGDMLYLPPGVAHHGISLGNCITYSIGFRAPSHLELVQSYLQTAIEQVDTCKLYADPDLSCQQHPHEITQKSIDSLRKTVEEYLSLSPELVHNWAGILLSEGKEQFQAEQVEEELTTSNFTSRWQNKGVLYRNTALKFLYINTDTTLNFYIDGQHLQFPAKLAASAEWLCSALQLSWHDWQKHPEKENVLTILYNFYYKGFYYFE